MLFLMNFKLNPITSVNDVTLQKMNFIFNALENGWTVEKKESQFIFTKPHEGKKEVFSDNYLFTFMKDCFEQNKKIG